MRKWRLLEKKQFCSTSQLCNPICFWQKTHNSREIFLPLDFGIEAARLSHIDCIHWLGNIFKNAFEITENFRGRQHKRRANLQPGEGRVLSGLLLQVERSPPNSLLSLAPLLASSLHSLHSQPLLCLPCYERAPKTTLHREWENVSHELNSVDHVLLVLLYEVYLVFLC